PAPPMRSFYAPCLPSKRALLPQLAADPQPSAPPSLEFDSANEPPPCLPLCRPSPSPSSNSPTGTETSPDSPS
ncbi:unnamed protein product, partial [Rangifer tarandus platyrhynchus]